MKRKTKEESCIMCNAGTVDFYEFDVDNEKVILGACDCGYCCGKEQKLGKF